MDAGCGRGERWKRQGAMLETLATGSQGDAAGELGRTTGRREGNEGTGGKKRGERVNERRASERVGCEGSEG